MGTDNYDKKEELAMICLAILQGSTGDQPDEIYAKLQLIMLAATWSQVNKAAGSCSSNYVLED